MMKKTKRKGFSFLRSYFDVVNKLQTDEDKLSFLLAVINKQFLNEDPKVLKFPVDLAYESQINAIDSSVKGWIRATKTDLQGNPKETTPPTPPNGKTNPLPKEEKEEEEEKEVYIYKKTDFLKLWEQARMHWDKKPTFISKLTFSETENFNTLIKTYGDKEFREAINGLFFQDSFPKLRLRPTFLLELKNFEEMRTCWLTQDKVFNNKK